MTSRVRRAHLALADERAMEWENERHNPVNPKMMLNNRKEDMNRLVGQGATPSMGLSEFRGGGTTKGMKRRTARLAYEKPTETEAYMMGHHLGQHLHNLHGGAYHKDFCMGMTGGAMTDEERRATIKANAEKRNAGLKAMTPEQQKANLANLKAEQDKRYEDAQTGHSAKRAEHDTYLQRQYDEDTAKERAEYDKAHPFNAFARKVNHGLVNVAGEIGKHADTLEKVGIPKQLSQALGKTSDFLKSDYEGRGYSSEQRAGMMLSQKKKGRSRNNGMPLLSGNVNGVRSGGATRRMMGCGTGAGMLEEPMPIAGTNLSLSGGANTGAYEGQGRNKRAEIVKQVMREKGLKMIEASKYVKAHGLY